MTTLIQAIVTHHQAVENCKRSGNAEWEARHNASLRELFGMLPSGSGIDCGTRVVAVSVERVKLACNFHHMDEHGSYDGWTEHEIRVTPGWHGLDVKVRGPNRNEILDYLHEVYTTCLSSEVAASPDGPYRFSEGE